MEPQKPRFLIVAEEEAAKRGVPTEQVLEEDRTAVVDSTYPGSNCLQPYEVESLLLNGRENVARMQHLRECATCCALMTSATAEDEEFERLREVVREERDKTSEAEAAVYAFAS